MRLRDIMVLATFGCLILTAANATAEPPSGSTCVSGYNPDALTNVCYKNNPGSTVNVPSITTNDELCLVGDICAPMVGVGPSRPQPVPGGAAPTYVEVNGAVLYSSDEPIDDAVVDLVGEVAGNAVGCVTTPYTPAGTWARDYVDCVRGTEG